MADMLQLDELSNCAYTCQSGAHYTLIVVDDVGLQALGLNHLPM